MKEPWEFEDPSCRGIDTELFYVDGSFTPAHMDVIKTICARCPERAACLEWAVHHERFGIWAGTTESQRRQIRRKRKIHFKEISGA